MAAKDVWDLVHACYGEELGVEAGAAENEDFRSCQASNLVKNPSSSSFPNLLHSSDDHFCAHTAQSGLQV